MAPMAPLAQKLKKLRSEAAPFGAAIAQPRVAVADDQQRERLF